MTKKITVILLSLFIAGLSLRLYQPLSTGHIVGVDGYYHIHIADLYKQGIMPLSSYPPGIHITLFLFNFLTGIGMEFSAILLSSFFSAIAVIAAFLLTKTEFGGKAGLYAAMFVSLSSAMIVYGSRVKNLNFVLPILLFGLLLNAKNKTIPFIATFSILILFSPFDACLLAIFSMLYNFLDSKTCRHKLMTTKFSLYVILLISAVFIASFYVNGSIISLYFTKAIPEGMNEILFYTPSASELLTFLSPIMLAFGIIGIFYSVKKRKFISLIILLSILLIIFPLRIIETDRCYVYITAFLSIFSGYGLFKFMDFVGKTRFSIITRAATIIIILMSSGFLISEGLKYNNWGIMNEKRYDMFRWLRYNTPQNSVVLGTITESNWISGIGSRKPMADSNLIAEPSLTQHFNDIYTIYTTENQSLRKELLNRYDISYIIISDKTYWRFGDVRNNFNAMDFELVYRNEPYEIFRYKR